SSQACPPPLSGLLSVHVWQRVICGRAPCVFRRAGRGSGQRGQRSSGKSRVDYTTSSGGNQGKTGRNRPRSPGKTRRITLLFQFSVPMLPYRPPRGRSIMPCRSLLVALCLLAAAEARANFTVTYDFTPLTGVTDSVAATVVSTPPGVT